MSGSLCDVPGLRVGHFHDGKARTGCTVILPDNPAVCGVDVRGSAPGSRETDLLQPVRLVQTVDAVLLTGGSAFGLAAADGVVRFLSEQGRGFDTGVARVPIVPAAVIFDLAVGDTQVRPNPSFGYQACLNAEAHTQQQGLVGAGCGATVGKLLGMERSSPGGLGMASIRLPDGLVVAALAVVNALGEVIDEQGTILAGIRGEGGKFIPSLEVLAASGPLSFRPHNTTLVVAATNARLTREEAVKVAQMAQDGIAMAVRPAHTMLDGDIVFALSVGDSAADVSRIGAFACQVVAQSIRNAVLASSKQSF